MDVFDIRHRLVEDYSSYISSFIRIRDPRLHAYVKQSLEDGLLWPNPLIQLNPSFEPGAWIDELVRANSLHGECSRIFRIKPDHDSAGKPMRLHKHQTDAIRVARGNDHYIHNRQRYAITH